MYNVGLAAFNPQPSTLDPTSTSGAQSSNCNIQTWPRVPTAPWHGSNWIGELQGMIYRFHNRIDVQYRIVPSSPGKNDFFMIGWQFYQIRWNLIKFQNGIDRDEIVKEFHRISSNLKEFYPIIQKPFFSHKVIHHIHRKIYVLFTFSSSQMVAFFSVWMRKCD